MTKTGRYVQYGAYGSILRAEWVGDRYLSGTDLSSDTERAWLAAHGWSDPDAGGNHWRHYEPAGPPSSGRVCSKR